MNGMEVEFLFGIEFLLYVTPDTFEEYRSELCGQSLSPTSHSSQMQVNPVARQQSMCCPSPKYSAVNARLLCQKRRETCTSRDKEHLGPSTKKRRRENEEHDPQPMKKHSLN
jgi:hypothetical protein